MLEVDLRAFPAKNQAPDFLEARNLFHGLSSGRQSQHGKAGRAERLSRSWFRNCQVKGSGHWRSPWASQVGEGSTTRGDDPIGSGVPRAYFRRLRRTGSTARSSVARTCHVGPRLSASNPRTLIRLAKVLHRKKRAGASRAAAPPARTSSWGRFANRPYSVPGYACSTTPCPLPSQEGNKRVVPQFFLRAGRVSDNSALSRKILPTGSNNRINTY